MLFLPDDDAVTEEPISDPIERRLAAQALITAMVLFAGVLAMLGQLGPAPFRALAGGVRDLGNPVTALTTPPSVSTKTTTSGTSRAARFADPVSGSLAPAVATVGPAVGGPPTTTPTAPAPATGPTRQVTMSREFIATPKGTCDTPVSATREGWCVVAVIDKSPIAGRPTVVSVLACRQANRLPGLLTFPTGPEIKVAVFPTVNGTDADAQHPVYVATNADQPAHTLAAEAGTCWRWSTSLKLVDAAGRAVTPCIRWQVSGQTYAIELSRQSPAETPFYPSPPKGTC